MKKLAVFLATILLTVCLSGCSGNSTGSLGTGGKDSSIPPAVSESFSGAYNTTANIKYRDISAQAVFTKDAGGTATVTFTSPDSLKDIKFVYTEQLVTVSYKEMEFSLDPSSFLVSSVAQTVISSMNMVTQQNGVQVQLKEQGLCVTGEMETGNFELVLDRESGNALRLNVPQDKLEVEFINFSFIK